MIRLKDLDYDQYRHDKVKPKAKAKARVSNVAAMNAEMGTPQRTHPAAMMPFPAMSSFSLNAQPEPADSVKRDGDKIKARHGFLPRSHPERVAARDALASDPHPQQLAALDDHLSDDVVSAVAPGTRIVRKSRSVSARVSPFNFVQNTHIFSDSGRAVTRSMTR